MYVLEKTALVRFRDNLGSNEEAQQFLEELGAADELERFKGSWCLCGCFGPLHVTSGPCDVWLLGQGWK